MLVFLARLVAFMIVISVIRSVVDYIKRLWHGSAQQRFSQQRPSFRPPNSSHQSEASTVLKQDPVCGTYVAIDTSLKKIVSGKVYHFCSEECRGRFTA
jgi:YHS domain-containing protein